MTASTNEANELRCRSEEEMQRLWDELDETRRQLIAVKEDQEKASDIPRWIQEENVRLRTERGTILEATQMIDKVLRDTIEGLGAKVAVGAAPRDDVLRIVKTI